jgi:putative transposase
MKDTVFQHILKPLTKKLMDECTNRFQSDYYSQTFRTIEHLRSMIYANIYEIKSLRTLEIALNSQSKMRNKIRRSTLSDANAKRPAECFFWLLDQIMSLLPARICKEIKKVVRILDSSPIRLVGYGYDDWAKEYATNRTQGLKLHVEYDLALRAPTRTAISYPNLNDSTMGQAWRILTDVIYVFDKGYCDFNWWWSIHQKGAFFVTRLKKNTAIVMGSSYKVTSQVILQDGSFRFQNRSPRAGKKNLYTENLRRISVKRDGKSPLILVTNLHDLPAEHIADLYRSRWEIELFFKWIKQNLKLKKFLGRSVNAVKIQLATALITYLLVQIFKRNSGDKRSLMLVLVWVKHNLYVRRRFAKKQSPPNYKFQNSGSILRTIHL